MHSPHPSLIVAAILAHGYFVAVGSTILLQDPRGSRLLVAQNASIVPVSAG
jgi:hypothetical protein